MRTLQEYMACRRAVLEGWPETQFAQRLKDMPKNISTLRECVLRPNDRVDHNTDD